MNTLLGLPKWTVSLAAAPKAPVDVAEATRLLASSTLKKDERQYRPVAFESGPGGEIYVAYQCPEQKYLARVEPDGSTAWEVPLQLKSVQRLSVSPDGHRILIKSDEGLVCLTREGNTESQVVFPSPSYGEGQTDASGQLYLTREARVYAYDAGGQPVELPCELTSVYGHLTRTPEGGLLVRAGDELVRLGPGGAVQHSMKLARRASEGKMSYSWSRVWPLEDHEVIAEEVTSIEMSGPHRFLGRGYGGFGGWGGSCMDPDHYAPQWITTSKLVRIGSDGAQKWATDRVGDSPSVFVTRGGTVYVVAHDGLDVYGPDGKPGERLKFPGTPSYQPARDGGVLVSHGQGVTRLNGDRREDFPLSTGDLRLKGELADGRLVFLEDEKRELLVCEEGRFRPLTDRWVEHLRPQDLPRREIGQVHEQDGYVVVNGVRVKVRPS
ncbi:MAG: hypothetical protein AB1758_16120 [Candidatus Eremiobacterota bacterium]